MKQDSKAPLGYEGARSKVIALSGILSATVAVLTFIVILFPAPLGGYDSSSILILSLPILLGPELGTIIVCTGEFVGTLFLLGVGAGFLYYLPGIVAVRGPEAYLVGKLARSKLLGEPGKRKELLAMTVGPIWETIGFVVPNYYIAYIVWNPVVATVWGLALIPTLVDLIWVIPAIALVSAIRKWAQASYLDKQMGLEGNEKTKKGLFRVSELFILISWILLALVPFMFRDWFPQTPA